MQKAHDASKNDFWRNKPDTSSPITQTELNRIETSIDTIDDRVVAFDTTKANQSDILQAVKSIGYTASTGTFRITFFNDNFVDINTDIEKVAVNFDFDDDPESPHYQEIVIELDDGTYKYVDLSAFITQFEFLSTTTIQAVVSQDGKVSFNIINGSITEDKLQPNFLADCRAAKNAAEAAEASAIDSKEDSEAWAIGKRNGIDVPSTDETYHNNAKYYAASARAITGNKVDTWNGRDGMVEPLDDDYDITQINPTASATAGQIPSVDANGRFEMIDPPNIPGGTYYGVCNSAIASVNKSVTIQNFELKANIIIILKFTNGNNISDITLNINNTGAKSVYEWHGYDEVSVKANSIAANELVTLLYDGTNYYILSTQRSSTEIWTDAVTGGIGDIEITITHPAILANDAHQILELYSKNASELSIGTHSIVTTNGQAVITLNDSLSEATDFKLKITFV